MALNLHVDLQNDQLHKPRDWNSATGASTPYNDPADVYSWKQRVWHEPVLNIVEITSSPNNTSQGARYYVKDLAGTTPHADWGGGISGDNIAHRGLSGTVPTWFLETMSKGHIVENDFEEGLYRFDGTTLIAAHFIWKTVTDITDMEVNHGYICNAGFPVSMRLPIVCTVGSRIMIVSINGGFVFTQTGASEQTHFLDESTTVGISGTVTPDEEFATLEIVCVTEGVRPTGGIWLVRNSVGTFSIA